MSTALVQGFWSGVKGQVTNSPEFNTWFAEVDALLTAHRKLQWEIGDRLLAGEVFDTYDGNRTGGPIFSAIGEVARRTGYDIDRLRNFKRVAKVFPPDTRHRVSYGHHEAVAAIEDPAERENLLDQAEIFKTTVADVAEAVRLLNGGKPKPRYYKPREDPRVVTLAKEGARVGVTADEIVRAALDEFFEGATAEIWLAQRRGRAA